MFQISGYVSLTLHPAEFSIYPFGLDSFDCFFQFFQADIQLQLHSILICKVTHLNLLNQVLCFVDQVCHGVGNSPI